MNWFYFDFSSFLHRFQLFQRVGKIYLSAFAAFLTLLFKCIFLCLYGSFRVHFLAKKITFSPFDIDTIMIQSYYILFDVV